MSSRLLSLFSALLALLSLVHAQSSTTVLLSPSAAASRAAPGAGTHGYTYAGCWNETTGVSGAAGARALADGVMESSNNMTTEICLAYCAASSMQYCGMEYGRECWGAFTLNTYSAKLSDSNCTYACEANATEVCGGSLTISLFNLTDANSLKTAGAARQNAEMSVWIPAALLSLMSIGLMVGL